MDNIFIGFALTFLSGLCFGCCIAAVLLKGIRPAPSLPKANDALFEKVLKSAQLSGRVIMFSGADKKPHGLKCLPEWNECHTCGIGYYLPSGVCDHCNSREGK